MDLEARRLAYMGGQLEKCMDKLSETEKERDALQAQVAVLRGALEQASYNLKLYASHCPINIELDYSGLEEHPVRYHEHGHDLKIIGVYEEALRKVHLNCVFNGRVRTEKGRFYLISEETAQAVDDALNHWRKGAGKCFKKK